MADVVLDLTRKQIAGERVVWTVRKGRQDRGPRIEGQAEAVFRGERIVSVRLGPAGPPAGFPHAGTSG